MKNDTWNLLEQKFADFPILRATPATPEEIEKAALDLNCQFHEDYVEFLRRYGGAMVGPYPIFGLNVPEVMGDPGTVVAVTSQVFPVTVFTSSATRKGLTPSIPERRSCMFRFKHRFRPLLAGPLLALLALVWCAQAWTADALSVMPIDKYTRINAPLVGDPRLETAVHTFRSKTDPNIQVDLISVIHVGEKAYYEEINKMLDGYDAVLFECIAETKPGAPRKIAYEKMAKVLGLEPQVKHINYDRSHFVHADMTIDQLRDAFRKHGLPMDMPDDDAMAKDISVLTPVQLRWLMMIAMMGKDKAARPTDKVVIQERNQVALDVLTKTLAKGKRKIAIFYGVGHMPHMERELIARFNMTPGGERWLAAWTLPEPEPDLPKAAATPGRLAASLPDARR